MSIWVGFPFLLFESKKACELIYLLANMRCNKKFPEPQTSRVIGTSAQFTSIILSENELFSCLLEVNVRLHHSHTHTTQLAHEFLSKKDIF